LRRTEKRDVGGVGGGGDLIGPKEGKTALVLQRGGPTSAFPSSPSSIKGRISPGFLKWYLHATAAESPDKKEDVLGQTGPSLQLADLMGVSACVRGASGPKRNSRYGNGKTAGKWARVGAGCRDIGS